MEHEWAANGVPLSCMLATSMTCARWPYKLRSMCSQLMRIVAHAGVLWSVSGQLVVFLFLYAGVGTVVTTSVFGKVLMRLNYTVSLLCQCVHAAVVRVCVRVSM